LSGETAAIPFITVTGAPAGERTYSGGAAVYNPPGNQRIEVKFDRSKGSRATGHFGTAHVIAPGDGDIFLND